MNPLILAQKGISHGFVELSLSSFSWLVYSFGIFELDRSLIFGYFLDNFLHLSLFQLDHDCVVEIRYCLQVDHRLSDSVASLHKLNKSLILLRRQPFLAIDQRRPEYFFLIRADLSHVFGCLAENAFNGSQCILNNNSYNVIISIGAHSRVSQFLP